MDKQEFEKALREFETGVQKRLPSMINIYMANRGNREQETSFNHFIETLKRQRTTLLKEMNRSAKPAQKIRYFNIIYNMDSQLRSMGSRDQLRENLRKRRHTMEAPVVYDIGHGPECGALINIFDDGVLLKTTEKIALDHEIKVTIGEKRASGKAVWSIPTENGEVETGVKLIDIPADLARELNKFLQGKS